MTVDYHKWTVRDSEEIERRHLRALKSAAHWSPSLRYDSIHRGIQKDGRPGFLYVFKDNFLAKNYFTTASALLLNRSQLFLALLIVLF